MVELLGIHVNYAGPYEDDLVNVFAVGNDFLRREEAAYAHVDDHLVLEALFAVLEEELKAVHEVAEELIDHLRLKLMRNHLIKGKLFNNKVEVALHAIFQYQDDLGCQSHLSMTNFSGSVSFLEL